MTYFTIVSIAVFAFLVINMSINNKTPDVFVIKSKVDLSKRSSKLRDFVDSYRGLLVTGVQAVVVPNLVVPSVYRHNERPPPRCLGLIITIASCCYLRHYRGKTIPDFNLGGMFFEYYGRFGDVSMDGYGFAITRVSHDVFFYNNKNNFILIASVRVKINIFQHKHTYSDHLSSHLPLY